MSQIWLSNLCACGCVFLSLSGLQLKLDGQDQPFASFTYALSPLTKKSVPVDWKLFVAEDVQSQHIRWHELQAGDDLPKLITDFQNAYAMAVVLINTSDNYSLHPLFLSASQSSSYPLSLLPSKDQECVLPWRHQPCFELGGHPQYLSIRRLR